MKKKFLLVCMALLSLFGATAQTPPTTSTAGNDVWYYILCKPRSSDLNAKWLTGAPAGNVVTNTVFSATNDAILWKIVDNAGVLGLVNKQYGTYLNTDRAYDAVATSIISCVTTPPTTSLAFTPYVDQVAEPNGFYMHNVGGVPSTPSTLTFQFYSAGSGSNFRPINYGPNATNVNSSVKFLTLKLILLDQITTVTTANSPVSVALSAAIAAAQAVYDNPASTNTDYLNASDVLATKYKLFLGIKSATLSYDNSSEGLNPGQVSATDREQLKVVMDNAQAVFDDTNSSLVDIIAALDELNALHSIFKTQVIKPELSVTTDNWYFIQGTRPLGTYMTGAAAGTGTQVKDLPVIPDDTQLWKLVPNGDGFAMQNKASMEYMQTDFPTGTNLSTQATMPTKALRFIASTETYNKAFRFWIENTTSSTEALRLHAGGSGNGWGVMNWTGGANDNCTWLFLSYDELFRTEYSAAKTAARARYEGTQDGVEFGQYSDASARAALLQVVVAEEAKDISTMTQAELTAGTTALNNAVTTFNAVIPNKDFATLNSVTKVKWYRIINNMNPAGYATGKAMSSNGRTENQKFTYEDVVKNSDKQLFHFEMNADGTKISTIQNKDNKLFVGANGAMLAVSTPDNEFDLTPLDDYSFWIDPTNTVSPDPNNGYTSVEPLHAAQSGTEILNWPSGANSASSWRIQFVKQEDRTDFLAPYLAKRVQIRAKYEDAMSKIGTQIGEYPSAPVAALGVLATAEEAKDASTLTQAQLLQGINDMVAAAAAVVYNTDVKLLVSTTPNTNKWFRVINAAGASVTYATGKVMSSNGRIEKEAFTFEDLDVNSDAQLFKFELNAGQTKVANMINKSNGLYMSPAGGMISKDSVMKITNEFEITQLAGGRSFWIHPTMIDATDPANPYRLDPLHAAESGTMIVNWNAGAGSASAWLFEFVKEEATAVKNVEAFTYRVCTTNHIITIDGVENFEVYSVLGQKQNSKKALNSGVYFVKVNNAVKKVVID